MVYFSILGAIALAGGTIFQKLILRKRKVDTKLYLNAEFLAIVIAMLPVIYFFWNVGAAALELKNIFIFALVIIFSIIANLLLYYSMKWEKVTNLEPAKVLEPLFVILLAILFSFFISNVYEKNLNVIIPALLSAGALIFSHVKRHHFEFNKYFIAAILGSFFFALELVLSKLILEHYSPVSFYFVRCFSILIFAVIIFRPDFKKLNSKVRKELVLVGIFWVVYRVAMYYGYLNYGVVSTTLVMMLGPVFIYLFAWKFLKEKLNWRNIVAAFVIVGSVAYALLS